ncbi:GFA family protein [Oryzibacter oryziterrae]|uniref:GFA family protein n=1 Tax=Oryzibacter oryziterrae TaxID=2766474 RepID=UPI001F3E5E96|nr:GFA family protein [Oryzibacter oryziterrae]
MTLLTGGCQCGAIRFAFPLSAATHSSICHCRMCQKAFGAFYAPLVNVRADQLTWTRGQRKLYRSSNHVSRGFCADCGTPLTYEPDGENPAVAIGALDTPSAVPPTMQYGVENKIGYVDGVSALPAETTASTVTPGSYLGDITSYQHPDHDTAAWPPAKG